MRWDSSYSNNALYIFPNRQEVIAAVDKQSLFFLLPNEGDEVVSNIFILPEKKHFDYIIRFKEYGDEDIDEIYALLKESKNFSLVTKEFADEAFIDLIELCYCK